MDEGTGTATIDASVDNAVTGSDLVITLEFSHFDPLARIAPESIGCFGVLLAELGACNSPHACAGFLFDGERAIGWGLCDGPEGQLSVGFVHHALWDIRGGSG